MTKRQQVAEALRALAANYTVLQEAGKTVSPEGVEMRPLEDRGFFDLVNRFEAGKITGLRIEISEWLGKMDLRVNSGSLTLSQMLERIAELDDVLAGPQYDAIDPQAVKIAGQLQFIGAVRKELEALERTVRSKHGAPADVEYSFTEKVERLRRELWRS